MKKFINFLFLWMLLFSGGAMAGNYAECILDKMPGTVNGAITVAIANTCIGKYPQGYFTIEQGSARGLFGFKDGDACVMKKAASTPFHYAAEQIRMACACLYSEASFKGQVCISPFN